jgi:NADH dehydrogenase [ubiquinone] 1 alpha subcomplex assembly factor 5
MLFDRKALQMHRQRAAPRFATHDVLVRQTADMLKERLGDVKRDFQNIAVIGQGIEKCDLQGIPVSRSSRSILNVTDDQTASLQPEFFDLIMHNFSLHWAEDVPSELARMYHALKPGGLFLAAFPGGHTLYELRACLLDAEIAVMGGASPRLSPTVEISAASGLLQRAGFILPVTDMEILTLTYSDAFSLMRDLRGMGEANAHTGRLRHFTRRAIFKEMARHYQERFALPDGRIPATFEIIFMHGWKADDKTAILPTTIV